MRKKNSVARRYLALCLTALLLMTLIPGAIWAEEKTSISLEQAIRIIKDNFEIPGEFTKFTSGYSTFDNRSVWSMNWNAETEPGGNFNAQVDTTTGEVLNMYTWKPEPLTDTAPQKPVVSVAEARQIASKLLLRLASRHISELQLLPDENQVTPLSSYSPLVYTVRWQRVVDGIPFPDNGVTIGINGNDGKIVSYNLNWSLEELPDASGIISLEKAQQVFKETGMLELQYFLPPSYGSITAKDKKKVMLVYQLSHTSHGIIDAVTGEPLKPENTYYDGAGTGGMEYARKNDSAPAQATPLTPEEQAEIERNSKIISKEQAIASVKQWLDISDSLTLRSAQIEADWMFPENRTWILNWTLDRPEDDKPSNINARVNAFTGELEGFDSYYPSEDDNRTAASLNRDAAKKIAEDFLRKVQPQRFNQVKFDDSYNPGWTPVSKPGQNPTVQYFSYRRLFNGIPFPNNGLNVTVDAVNKRITSYRLTWYPLDFPAAAGVLNLSDANSTFIQKQPLTLVYIQLYRPDGQSEYKLVYRPQPPPGQISSQLMDARTGELLDWQGKPLSQQPRSRHFTDIEGNFAEKDIDFLGQAGLFPEYGDSFHPDENITVASMLRAMLMIKNGVADSADLTDEEVIKRARQYSWIKEDLPSGGAVSREMASKLVIRLLNLDRAARVEGIYLLSYKDARSLSPDSVGYVALAWGLNIMKGSNNYFYPDRPLTRAEAAVILVRTMEVKP